MKPKNLNKMMLHAVVVTWSSTYYPWNYFRLEKVTADGVYLTGMSNDGCVHLDDGWVFGTLFAEWSEIKEIRLRG